MRVYVPATLTMLHQMLSDGRLEPASLTAFALTPRLRENYVAGTEEELEYSAMAEAARASLRLIALEQAGGPEPRRVVVTAEVDGVTPRPDLDDGAVRLSGPLPLESVVAVHVDTAEAAAAVTAAAAVVDAADLGDTDAEFVLGDAEDHELAWYDPSELPFLLELL
ncbi:MAG: hypothetical protein H0W01_15395 [Pseudonocardiales bacterium]|nr:hypothetical protein [Pseudonocardiales bacterium]